MKRPFRTSQYNRHAQQPDLPMDRDPEIEQDLLAPRAKEENASSAEIIRQDQEPQRINVADDQLSLAATQEIPSLDEPANLLLRGTSDLPEQQVLLANQETSALPALEAPLSTHTTQDAAQLAKRAAIASQETSSIEPVRLSSPPPAQFAEQIAIAEQETSSLTPLHTPLPLPAQLISGVSTVDQETIALPVSGGSAPTISSNPINNPAGLFQYLFRTGLARLQEPQPEGLLTRGLVAVRSGSGLGLAPLLALTDASGLLIVSLSYYLSVLSYNYLAIESSYLGGLLLIFAPNLLRLLSRKPSRVERICILCILGIVAFFVAFMSNPLYFSSFDAALHWRTADDILRTKHLFTFNSMLPVSPYFPGLEIMTNAISTTTGLNTFYAGNIVTISARLLMILALYLLYEHITNSSRMASIAVLLYMVNQHFLYFDVDYSYETFALPLAILMVYILARYERADKNHRWVIVTAWIVLFAVTITHHMTDYVFDGLLLLWAGVNFFRPVARRVRIHLVTFALLAPLISLAYAFLLPGNPVWVYLSSYFSSIFGEIELIITGASSVRPLFSSTVQAPPVWDKLFMTGAVVLVTFCLPFGLITVQRLYRKNTLAITLGLASLLYPLTQAFRFTSFGIEITNRAAAFLFLPIAFVLVVLLTHFWPTRRLSKRAISLIAGAILVIFLGNVIAETGPNFTGLPGPYLVVADSRSVEPEGINAALWSLAYLGPDQRIATDRINQMLMSTFGGQRIITDIGDEIDVAPIFYSAQFDNADIAILQAGQIHYLVVDTRLSSGFPLEDTYFENDVPRSVISWSALTKFNAVTAINRVFDSGDIVIYDTGAFLKGTN